MKKLIVIGAVMAAMMANSEIFSLTLLLIAGVWGFFQLMRGYY